MDLNYFILAKFTAPPGSLAAIVENSNFTSSVRPFYGYFSGC